MLTDDLPRNAGQRARADHLVRFCSVPAAEHRQASLSGEWRPGLPGLIPARYDGYACFGVVYGKFSRNFARTVANAGEGYPSYELVFEWNYKIQLTKFAFVQPDIQWVINPGGTNRIPNALVLGAQMGVVF